MAQKRMFSKDIVRTDQFLDMPLSSQALYFHLCMDADVKGFVTPRLVMRMINSPADDLNVLITKKFVIPFESGVIVITHWNINNQIRETHEAQTQYEEELKKLTLSQQGLYQLQENYSSTTVELPHSIDKIRLDQDRLEENISKDISLKTEYGNKYINELKKYMIETLELPKLNGTEQNNRNQANNLIKEFKKTYNVDDEIAVDKIKKVISIIPRHEFWNGKINDFSSLKRNWVNLVKSLKEEKENARHKFATMD